MTERPNYKAPYRKRSTGRSFEVFWKVRLLSILLVVERPWILLSLALAIGAVRILTRLLESNGIQRTGGEIPRRFFAPSSAPIRPSSFAASPRCRVLPTVHCSPLCSNAPPTHLLTDSILVVKSRFSISLQKAHPRTVLPGDASMKLHFFSVLDVVIYTAAANIHVCRDEKQNHPKLNIH